MRELQPFISIVIPTDNRPTELKNCLESLCGLDYPSECFEVIVVNDGGQIPLERAVAPLRDRIDLKLLSQSHSGPAIARNLGAAHAKGKFLAFTDDDCAPASNWLRKLAARFAMAPDLAVGSRTLNALPSNPYSTASQFLIDYLYTYYNADPNNARFLTTNSLALPAERFYAVGGFDTTFARAAAEDRELCDRWLHHGYKMIYAPEAVVYHAHALTLRTFWRQHLNYGRGAFHFHEIRARRDQTAIKVEPLSFYLNLVAYPFSRIRVGRSLLVAALLVIAQVANVAGFFLERGLTVLPLQTAAKRDSPL
jgi:cellulose synthase/poly-beta-1,6-N-acetylglucosamine synthase-like glycosyltransferase